MILSSFTWCHSQYNVILSLSLGFPNGLSVDYDAERLYWVDAKLDKIETADFNGQNRVALKLDQVPHPFGLAVVRYLSFKVE